MRNDAATVLLTLGRLPSALEIARAFSSRGFRVIVAEPFAWPLCRLSKHVDKCFQTVSPVLDTHEYQSQLLSIMEDERVSLVIPVSEETPFVAGLKGRLPNSVKLVCMGQPSVLMLHDKYQFATWAARHDLPVPHTALADDEQALRSVLSSDYVLKPRLSCSGVGIRFGQANEALQGAEASSGNIVQQTVPGISCNTFTIASKGKPIIMIAYKSLLQSGSVSVCFEQIDTPAQIVLFVTRAVELLHYTGMISFDFLQDANGQWQAIECNPRATSGIHFVPQEQLVDALLEQAGGEQAVRASPAERRQEFWSSLTELESDLLKLKWNGSGWRTLFTTRDITWSLTDMKPVLLMPFVLAPQLWQAFRQKKPVSQILMLDVGWYRL